MPVSIPDLSMVYSHFILFKSTIICVLFKGKNDFNIPEITGSEVLFLLVKPVKGMSKGRASSGGILHNRD